MTYDWGSGYGFGWVGWLLMLLWWALIAVAVVVCVRYCMGSSGSRHGTDGSDETALDILKKRYARGEIDKKEFEEKRKDLEE